MSVLFLSAVLVGSVVVVVVGVKVPLKYFLEQRTFFLLMLRCLCVCCLVFVLLLFVIVIVIDVKVPLMFLRRAYHFLV